MCKSVVVLPSVGFMNEISCSVKKNVELFRGERVFSYTAGFVVRAVVSKQGKIPHAARYRYAF